MDGAGGNELPWASVFDSGANMRALTAIQAEGLRAASKLVDRFIVAASDSLNTRAGTHVAGSTLSADQRADLWGATDIEPLLKSWWAMVGHLGRAVAPAAEPGPDTPVGSPSLEFAEGRASGRLDLEVAPAGAAVAGIWLSNNDIRDLGEVSLWVGALQCDTGATLDPQDIWLAPSVVAMPGRSGRAVDLRVNPGPDTRPGLYRGNLFTVGHPGLWLPIALTVRDGVA